MQRDDLRLDGSTPRTGTNCPATSHLAEARNRAGRGPSQESAVLALLKRLPGQTASDYAHDRNYAYSVSGKALSGDFYERRQQIRRRLTDLKNKGLVIRIGAAGEGEVRWYPVRLPHVGE